MKTFISVILAVAFSACTHQAPGPVGPVIVDGPCHRTGLILVFLEQDEDVARAVVPLEAGCRCSIRIDGTEYVKTEVEETNLPCLETQKKLQSL